MGAPTIILIGGGSAAGKTTLAREIEKRGDDVQRLPMDNYYSDVSHMSHEEIVETNFDDPEWLRWEILHHDLSKISNGEVVRAPSYDFETGKVTSHTTQVGDCGTLIVEGIWALHDNIIKFGDVTIFVDADPDTRLIRRIRRDTEERAKSPEEIIDDFERNVKPMHDIWVEPTKREADIIVNGGYSDVAVDAVLGTTNPTTN